MRIIKLAAICALLALLAVPTALYAQEHPTERGIIEFGFRGITGDVYGRNGQPGTLPFSNGFRPDLLNSRINVYSDYRNAFYIPRFDTRIDSLFGTNNYLHVQSANDGLGFEGGRSLS